MRKFAKVLVCIMIALGLIYTPVIAVQFAGVSMVSEVSAASAKINRTKATITVGNTVRLKIFNTKNKVKWSTSNKKVATVTANGVVKGKKAGTVTIKARVKGKTYKCKVTVKDIPKLNCTEKVMYLNGQAALKVSGTSKKIKWLTSNKSVAAVTAKGVVTAKKQGKATITAKVGTKKLTCKVTVKNRISVDKNQVKIGNINETGTVKVTYIGKGKITNLSSDRSVATSKWEKKWSGSKNALIITAKKEGTAYISLTNSLSDEVCKIEVTVKAPEAAIEPEPESDMGKVKPENIEEVKDFADHMYTAGVSDSYIETPLPWEPVTRKTNWIYYTGLVHKGFLMLDAEKYYGEIKDFYTEHIRSDGTIIHYNRGELDSALPVYNMLTLLEEGRLTESERALYEKAINYSYSWLENQTVYPEAGGLMLHSQNPDGTIKSAWGKWNICLDGIYMSQVVLIKMAELIDEGKLVITQRDGTLLTAEKLWEDIYNRLVFVMNNMVDDRTGLIYHGYSIEDKTTNTAFWSRGIGWYTMALVEAAEKIPDTDRKAVLKKHYEDIMNAVVAWQDPETFLWYNVTDAKKEVYCKKGELIIENKPETSGSAMFAYCLLRGYQNGLLENEAYLAAGLRAFNSIVETKLTEEGLIDTLASGTVSNNKGFYQASGYAVNDGKGIGPLLMSLKYIPNTGGQ